MENEKISIAIVDDNLALQKSLARNLLLYANIEIVFTASNGIELLTKLKENKLPSVILMDIQMPKMNGIVATYEIFKNYAGKIKIIILTVMDEEHMIFDAIKAGACGYLMKDENPNSIIKSILDALNGGAPISTLVASKILENLRTDNIKRSPSVDVTFPKPVDYNLTKREIEILYLIIQAKTYKQIAEELFLSDKTIKKHTENIYYKLHINSKYEAMELARKYDWNNI